MAKDDKTKWTGTLSKEIRVLPEYYDETIDFCKKYWVPYNINNNKESHNYGTKKRSDNDRSTKNSNAS